MTVNDCYLEANGSVDLHKHTRERQKNREKKKHTNIWDTNQTLNHYIIGSMKQKKTNGK